MEEQFLELLKDLQNQLENFIEGEDEVSNSVINDANALNQNLFILIDQYQN